jgi:hypothetical protein
MISTWRCGRNFDCAARSGALFAGKKPRWAQHKGFHRTDKAAPPESRVSSEALWQRPFILPKQLYATPVAVAAEGVVFPRTKIPTLPRPVDDLLPVFRWTRGSSSRMVPPRTGPFARPSFRGRPRS